MAVRVLSSLSFIHLIVTNLALVFISELFEYVEDLNYEAERAQQTVSDIEIGL